jgi:hypothetical protein
MNQYLLMTEDEFLAFGEEVIEKARSGNNSPYYVYHSFWCI